MKPADPLPERRSTSKSIVAEPGPARSEEKERDRFEPQYLDLPWQQRNAGARNLVLGILLFLVAIGVALGAFRVAGVRSLVPLVATLLTFLTLFVLARARVLRQRNGGFVALALVCLLAGLIPMIDWAIHKPSEAGSGAGTKDGTASTGNPATEPPLLAKSFTIPPIDENGARFKVLRDLRVEIDGKPYLIKVGEVFPLAGSNKDEVLFTAGDQKIALPNAFVEMIGSGNTAATKPSSTPLPDVMPGSLPGSPADASAPGATPPGNETPGQITQRAQKEAIRRYPALGQKGSPQNQLFVETYQELKHSGADDFFADPQWPLQLAELLAKREAWQHDGAAPAATTPPSATPQPE